MTDATLIIARCTRNGVTAWQAVAAQLGRPVDSVRAQFDAGYERAYCWAPSRESVPEADVVIDFDDMSSPFAKGPGLKILILRTLQTGPACIETIATRLCRTTDSIRARLNSLKVDGLVIHDGRGGPHGEGRSQRTWSLTAPGLRVAVTGFAERVKEGV
jgi:hypothetical protein